MWIRINNRLYNLSQFPLIKLEKLSILFFPDLNEHTNDKKNNHDYLTLTFENENEAKQNFNYILEGFRNKSTVINI